MPALDAMNYIDVEWRHNNGEYPTRLVSELDEQRNEMRKLEFYADGAVGFASATLSSEGTELSIEPLPTLEYINSQAEFYGKTIGAVEFESLWSAHVSSI